MGARDFDFLHGEWTTRQRRLRTWLAGSHEWDEFEATVVSEPMLEGLGTVEEFRTDHDGGFIGMTFRFYDPATDQWAIYWASTRRPTLGTRPAGRSGRSPVTSGRSSATTPTTGDPSASATGGRM